MNTNISPTYEDLWVTLRPLAQCEKFTEDKHENLPKLQELFVEKIDKSLSLDRSKTTWYHVKSDFTLYFAMDQETDLAMRISQNIKKIVEQKDTVPKILGNNSQKTIRFYLNPIEININNLSEEILKGYGGIENFLKESVGYPNFSLQLLNKSNQKIYSFHFKLSNSQEIQIEKSPRHLLEESSGFQNIGGNFEVFSKN